MLRQILLSPYVFLPQDVADFFLTVLQVIAGVIGALAGLCAIISVLACIIRRKGYLRPRGRRRTTVVPVVSPDVSEKPGVLLSSPLGSVDTKKVPKLSPV